MLAPLRFVAALIVLATIVAARIGGSLVMRHSQRAANTIGSMSLFISVGQTLVAIVGGLAVALALQDTLANFFSGIQIAASRQVRAGDFVRIDADGNRIIVPNQKLAQAIFTAYRLPLPVPITVTLAG